jgi:hypothetical protein
MPNNKDTVSYCYLAHITNSEQEIFDFIFQILKNDRKLEFIDGRNYEPKSFEMIYVLDKDIKLVEVLIRSDVPDSSYTNSLIKVFNLLKYDIADVKYFIREINQDFIRLEGKEKGYIYFKRDDEKFIYHNDSYRDCELKKCKCDFYIGELSFGINFTKHNEFKVVNTTTKKYYIELSKSIFNDY